MRSIRLQFFSIILAILLILLVLLNTYPLISSRDLVFQEKESGMLSQAAVIASSLSGLESLGRAGIEEVLRLMDVSGFGRIAVADEQGEMLYDSAGGAVPEELLRAHTTRLGEHAAKIYKLELPPEGAESGETCL